MQQQQNNVVDMLKGTTRFVLENPITPALVTVTDLNTEITTCITNYEAAATAQTDGGQDSAGGVGTKLVKYKQLRAYMKDVARVGRTLDRDLYPGLAEHFVLPVSRGYAALVAGADAMIETATPHEAVFVARGLPATFLADLDALVTALNSGANAKIDGKLARVGGTSGQKYWAKKGLVAAQKLDAIIRAHFRNDPVMLDIWASARHIQLPPQRKADDELQPPTGGTGGSGTFGLVVASAEAPLTAVA